MRKLLVLALLAAAAVLASTSVGSAMSPKLVGTSGPGFTIEVTMGGKDVKTLKAGTYTMVVRDKSSIHNFHLVGPGVNKKTSVGAVATFTWKVTLKKGTYKYVCDPHKTIMKGSFTVS
jgi:plastocyanin